MTQEFRSISQVLKSDEIIDCNLDGNVHRVDNLIETINSLFKINFLGNYINYLKNKRIVFSNENIEDICENGIECKVLRTNGLGWQNAKIRLKIVLEIDLKNEEQNVSKPEISPLDDIRQAISENQTEVK